MHIQGMDNVKLVNILFVIDGWCLCNCLYVNIMSINIIFWF